MTGYVYFLRPVGQPGPIKVGHSAHPPSRLDAFQTWSPVPLELVSQFSATQTVERQVHDRFAKWHLHGEWFHPVEDLIALAEGVRDGKKVADLVDLSIKTGRIRRRPNPRSELAKIVGNFKTRIGRAQQFATDVRGKYVRLPEDVSAILNSAGGYMQAYRALTPAEVETLEAFISDCRSSDLVMTPSSPKRTRKAEAAS